MARYSRSSYRKSSSYVPRSVRKREERTQKNLVRNIILTIVLIYVIFFWGLPNLIGGLSFLHRSTTTNTQNSPTNDVTLAPPVLNIPFDATGSATLKVNGYASPNSKVEIFFDDTLKDTVSTDDNGSFQTDEIPLVIGVNNIYGKTVDSNNHESLPSKTIQLTYNNEQPKLDVSSPSDNSQIHGGDKKVNVSGDTDPDDTISINGVLVIVDENGHFSKDVSLNDGDNTLTITATTSVGNTTSVSRKVTYSSS